MRNSDNHEGPIKIIYDDAQIQVCSNKNLSKLAIYEKIVLAMLRQLNETPKGKERLKSIGAVVNCLGMD